MNSASQILDIAERQMRREGYNAVSYRDIASEMGIKSASLHYHFPKKADLGTALVRRYSANFQERLTAATQDKSDPGDMISAFVELYRFALIEQHLICLCAVLGAEAPGLPDLVTDEVKKFFKTNISWLTEQYEIANMHMPEDRAKTTLALLEGAMIISNVNDDPGVFEAASKTVLASFVM